jgi:hypothetical protein
MKIPMPRKAFWVVTGQLALLFLIGLGLFFGFWELMVPEVSEDSHR